VAKPRVDWKPAFLHGLATRGTVSAACEVAEIARSTAYAAREHDPDFAEAWDEIDERVVDMLEAVAIERAARDSDKLLELLLKAKRPRIYRESTNVNVSGTIEHALQLPDDPAELERLAEELRKRRAVETRAEEIG
jgi:hypothetical protein